MCVFIFLVKVTEWPPIGKIAAHSAYEMFSLYKYLIVGFPHLGFWSGNLFLIAPFPDLCLLVPLCTFLDGVLEHDIDSLLGKYGIGKSCFQEISDQKKLCIILDCTMLLDQPSPKCKTDQMESWDSHTRRPVHKVVR